MRRTFLPLLTALSLTLFALFSCQKTETIIAATEVSENFFTVAKARAWFESTHRSKSISGRTNEKVKIKTFTPLWNEGMTGANQDYYFVECPTNFSSTPGFIIYSPFTNTDTSKIKGKTKLLVLQSKTTGKNLSALMHVVSENGSNEEVHYKQKDSRFTGHIFFTDLEGAFINGWQYMEGKTVKQSKRIVAQTATEEAAGIPQDPFGEECASMTINWYERICSYQQGVQIGCTNWEYIGSTTQTYCNYGGGGDGGVDEQYIELQDDAGLEGAFTICTKSFTFQKYIETSNGVGGWQVAGVKNVHMNIIDLSTKKIVPLYLPVMYFGLPVIKSNGDFYSTTTAGNIASDAVEYAEQKVMEYYHSLGGALDVVGMSLYYRKKIDEYMQTKGGSASLSSGSNISNVPIMDAVYSGFLGLNCL